MEALKMSKISEHTALGDLVDTHPLSSGVLLRYGLDFCCGGQQSLGDACRASRLEPAFVLRELGAAISQPAERPWSEATSEELVTHILERYHAPLPDLLSTLESLADRVLNRHKDKDPERLQSLRNTVHELSSELASHMGKEETILFPWILHGHEPTPVGPIQCMLMEHEHAGEMLSRLGMLTDNYQPPEGACRSWRALYSNLQHLDGELRAHIHLENNILFLRVVQ
jgi:regulator of cell morphogenesis and NO signaling